MMANLGQRELTSQFDTYKWQKLVIEFAEVITNNTHSDKLILNKLKNIIWADKITVNEKWVQPYQIENIVWTFISSNSNVPLLLDDKDKWNRRFTLIKSTSSLTNWKKINNSIRDKKIVSDFLAWLFQQYPQVSELKSYEAHDNQEKRDLEDISQSDAAHFWEWFEENFPDQVWNILKTRIDIEIGKYCEELEINDITSFTRWFWKTSKYPKTRRRFNWKLKYCVEIPKK